MLHSVLKPLCLYVPRHCFSRNPRPIPIALVRRIDGKIQQVPLVGYGGKPDPEEDPKKNRNGIWIACYIVGYIAWHMLVMGH